MIEELAKYIDNGRVLFKAPDIPYFRIPIGVEEIVHGAFNDCDVLQVLDIPCTLKCWEEPRDRRLAGIAAYVKVNVWRWYYPENLIISEEMQAEIENGWRDEFGAVYSYDQKRLLQVADVRQYFIQEGTEYVEKTAFVNASRLKIVHFPYTWKYDRVIIEGIQMGNGKYIDILRFHDKPYIKRRLK